MRKIIAMAALIFSSILIYACTDGTRQKQIEKQETTQEGNVIAVNKDMFTKEMFDYEESKEWKHRGDKPAIIGLCADWCDPCCTTAPITRELVKECAGKVVIYKVNIDKERELTALFNITGIPFFVSVPVQGKPQSFRGTVDRTTYKKAIDEFLLKK